MKQQPNSSYNVNSANMGQNKNQLHLNNKSNQMSNKSQMNLKQNLLKNSTSKLVEETSMVSSR